MSLLVVSTFIGTTSPVFAGYGNGDLENSIYDQHKGPKIALKALDIALQPSSNQRLFNPRKSKFYTVNWKEREIMEPTDERRGGALKVGIADVMVDKTKGFTQMKFYIAQGGACCMGEIKMSHRVLTHEGKKYFNTLAQSPIPCKEVSLGVPSRH